MLVVCFLVSLSAALAAPIVRRQILLPAIRCEMIAALNPLDWPPLRSLAPITVLTSRYSCFIVRLRFPARSIPLPCCFAGRGGRCAVGMERTGAWREDQTRAHDWRSVYQEGCRVTLSLICPHDRHSLTETPSGLSCAGCGRQYPIQGGVVCTLDHPDGFYEGAYENQTHFLPRSEKPWHAWPLWLINGGYPWTVRRFVPAGATVGTRLCRRSAGQRYRCGGL